MFFRKGFERTPEMKEDISKRFPGVMVMSDGFYVPSGVDADGLMEYAQGRYDCFDTEENFHDRFMEELRKAARAEGRDMP